MSLPPFRLFSSFTAGGHIFLLRLKPHDHLTTMRLAYTFVFSLALINRAYTTTSTVDQADPAHTKHPEEPAKPSWFQRLRIGTTMKDGNFISDQYSISLKSYLTYTHGLIEILFTLINAMHTTLCIVITIHMKKKSSCAFLDTTFRTRTRTITSNRAQGFTHQQKRI